MFTEIAVITSFAMTVDDLDGEIEEINRLGEDWGDGHIRNYPFIEIYNANNYEHFHPFKMGTEVLNIFNDDYKYESMPTWFNFYHVDPVRQRQITSTFVYCKLVQYANLFNNSE